MSNEELALRIKNGETDFYLELWLQVRNFVVKQAIQYSKTSGYEVDDLIQSGFLAMVKAANNYDPAGGASFIHFLSFHLHNEFDAANGIGHKRNRDPIEHAISLNTPLDDSQDAATLEDLQPDPRDPYEEAERRIYLEQLQHELTRIIGSLPEDQQRIITYRYYEGLTMEKTGAKLNKSFSDVRALEYKALQEMKRQRELRQFIDDNTPFYGKVTTRTFNVTHESIVEKCVLKREHLRKER